MIKHDKKDKMAILTAGLIILLAAIIIIAIIAGIITALAEFFTSKKGLEGCDA